jgi:DNA helicase-2/ATP-dependent DNA helicase PcrA
MGADLSGVVLPYSDDIENLLREASEGDKARTVDLPTHLSSTDVVRLAADRESYALARRRPMPRISGAATRRGDAFHAWVERYYRMPTLADPEDAFEYDVGVGPAPGVDLAELRRAFIDGEWAGRRPTAVEADVEIPVEEFVLRCRIDAVFPPGNGLDKTTIVDWKTGKPAKGSRDSAAREAQLAVYRLAWAAWKKMPLADIDAVFVFLPSGEVVRPARLLDRDEILAVVRGR